MTPQKVNFEVLFLAIDHQQLSKLAFRIHLVYVEDCTEQFEGTNHTTAGAEFCDCVHKKRLSLVSCLGNYQKATDDVVLKE